LASSRPRYAGKSEIDWRTRPESAGRLRDADVDADAEVARQVDSTELWLNFTNELRRWSVRKRALVYSAEARKEGKGKYGMSDSERGKRERERENVEEEKILALGFCPFCRHCVDEFITDTPSLDFHPLTPQSKSDRADLLHYLSLSLSLFRSLLSIYLSLSLHRDIRLSNVGLMSKRREIRLFISCLRRVARYRRRGSVPFCVKLRWISRNKPKSRVEV